MLCAHHHSAIVPEMVHMFALWHRAELLSLFLPRVVLAWFQIFVLYHRTQPVKNGLTKRSICFSVAGLALVTSRPHWQWTFRKSHTCGNAYTGLPPCVPQAQMLRRCHVVHDILALITHAQKLCPTCAKKSRMIPGLAL